MKELRQELIESQKARFQLFQWKLLIVATLAATGLGFTGSNSVPGAKLVLCCIPFACVYVDALIYHQGIIAHVIGAFLRSQRGSSNSESNSHASYELFALRVRHLKDLNSSEFSAFDLDKLTLHKSSIVLSIGVAAYAWISKSDYQMAFIASGALGVVASLILNYEYNKRRRAVIDCNKP